MHDLRWSYLETGIYCKAESNYTWTNNNLITGAQFVKCGTAVVLYYESGRLYNGLLAGCGTDFYGSGTPVWCVNTTFVGSGGLSGGESLYFTNCLVVGNTNGVTDGANNKFLSSATGVFQTAGGAGYYLAANCPAGIRNAGTTNIDAALLASLQTMTTYAPQDGGWSDTNGTDLGYHYPLNEDSDYDGLPDWWEWKYFGNYTHYGSDLDAGGNTLLFDYANGIDLTVIQFSIGATNNYVNHTNVSVQLTITAGMPSYYAVFVNSSTTTNWLPFTTTNLTANLDTTDGVYDVIVGLRDAAQSWNDFHFTLDRVAPIITVTNPIISGSTVSTPMIQLQGFANENLSSLTFDVSNTTGIFTNQTGFITGYFWDTNLLVFTTNYFQCYDIVLTNGLNVIALHAFDLSGNKTTTNVTVTVNYSGDATPPALTLLWPQSGTPISGDFFTLQAQIDDYTATVTASIVNTNGETNMVQGMVERNGLIWVDGLPLTPGANVVTLTATDAAGNSTVESFTVTGKDAGLTLNPLTDDQLNQPHVIVTGTVGDASYSVTVNGIAATVSGDLTWEADSVPVNPNNTASFYVEVRDSSGNLVTTHAGTQPQPVTVGLMSYNGYHYSYFFSTGDGAGPGGYIPYPWFSEQSDSAHWTLQDGGRDVGHDFFTGYFSPFQPGHDYEGDNVLAAGEDGFSPGYGWENAALTTHGGPLHRFSDTVTWSGTDNTQTRVAIRPHGPAGAGTTVNYSVRAQLWDEGSGQQLPPSATQIRGWH